jgi:hypothetical protein
MMILPSLENHWSRESTPRHLQAHAGELGGRGETPCSLAHGYPTRHYYETLNTIRVISY